MGLFGKLSLGAKIGLSIAFVLVLGVAVVGLFSVIAIGQSTETTLQERQSMARLIANYEDEILQHALAEMESASAILSSDDSSARVNEVQAKLDANLRSLGMHTEDVLVVGPGGEVKWSSSNLDLNTDDMFSFSSVSSAAQEGTSTISGAVWDQASGRNIILLSAQLRLSSGGNPGALVAAIDIAESGLGNLVESVRLGQTGYIEVVDQNGAVLLRTNPGRPLSPFEMSDHPGRFAKLIAEKRPVTGTCHTCHESGVQSGQDVLAFVPMSKSPWGVAVRQSQTEALAPVRKLRDRFLASGAILLALALGTTWVTSRDMVNRIRQLRDASTRMAQGDLETEVRVNGGDEITALGSAFDQTRMRLRQSYAEIERTTREAEEAKARSEADRLKSQFISAMSHELRTPLTSIKGYATSLLREEVDWDKTTTTEFLNTISQKADELNAMIDKLLQTTKIEGGEIKLDKEPVVLARLAEKVVRDNGLRSPKHELSYDFPLDIPVVEADSHYIERVLHNLVENAVKYSPDGGKIEIKGKVELGEVVVSVRDQGIGIALPDLDRVFDRFYRADDTLSRRVGGTGLGLFISRALVEAHGGRIWAESRIGEGSTFYFSVPLPSEQVEEETPDS